MQKLLYAPDEAFEQEMKRRYRCYQKQLKDILPCLPKAMRSFVDKESFNGGYVSFIKIEQKSEPVPGME